jgi:hypothetical protein
VKEEADMAQTWAKEQLVQLRDNLVKYFSDEELRDLCFSLSAFQGLKDLDYDSLPAQGKAAKARELVAYVGRNNCIPALAKKCRELRPDVDWLGAAAPEPPPLQTEPRKPIAEPAGPQTPSLSTTSKVTIISVALGFAGVVIVAAYLGYMGIKWQLEAPIMATQTAEARLTPLVTATIRLDALAVPEGWMSGDQANPTKYISATTLFEGCHAGPGCGRWTFKPGGGWASVLWWPPGCRFDTLKTCGINLLAQGGFSAIDRLTFWARGDKGGEIIEFKFRARQIKVKLSPTWERYELGVSGTDLTQISELFLCSVSDADNPGGAVFDLDNIQFEGRKP